MKLLAEATTSTSTSANNQLVLNFTTPHAPVYSNKIVDKVIVPGEAGDYGITALHSPIISQLAPGVVTIINLNGETEQFFIPGGFAITHANSVTDLSTPEAFPLSDFDPAEVRAGLTAVQNKAASSDLEKATRDIELRTYSILARALGIAGTV
eukprot:CAMPEP_0196765398 /NCGR_PEP_ID=MMETSP1095-20130614/8576_1 /TAXON_ID=96789 ORGANISM="Chromulina nebulosa, Strain UTEXLB2642" /NCGR_SAMPLE_ID=MMETSP1095 /ASSEMBLY_ACC=CAM_ASM_000446 /LENGTH=152 /DNA_ID=CAMNT_0042123363 /DNA_START=89 /DNA_END=547 /DNA_ORIENTATION=+